MGGTPPRMRGTHGGDFQQVLSGRNTPAYAGNTLNQWRITGDDGEHPRVCGEH